MNAITKQQLLQNVNTIELTVIKSILDQGFISLDEFKEAGLDYNKIEELESLNKETENTTNKESEKQNVLSAINNNQSTIDEIQMYLSNGILTIEDLQQRTNLSHKSIQLLVNLNTAGRTTIFKRIEDLPPMEEGKTDVYFVGVPGSGKSTILSGLLYMAHKKGLLLNNSHNQGGAQYQDLLINDMRKGLLPAATASGSYNYIPLSLQGSDGAHPLNVVEVPGENYNHMYNNGDVASFLNYINNNNKKIIIFVIDSLVHNEGYINNAHQLDQSLVYANILELFRANQVLEKTDSVYIVVNKFDAIKNTRYFGDARQDTELALDFVQEEFLAFVNNCKNARENSKNQFKIKVIPFSIGDVQLSTFVNYINEDFCFKLLNNIIDDSFIQRGGRTRGGWKIFN
jgi:hypothetical protein